MKRAQSLIIFIILLFLSQNCVAQGAYYVYKKNGDVLTLFADQIKSISYSKTSADGIEYEDVVSQVVETADSVYITDIAEVDSVGFHPLPTVLRSGVTVLDDNLMDYIISASDGELSFILSASVPKKFIPNVGDKLVTTTCNNIFSNAFAGRVNRVSRQSSGIIVECEDVDLTEIFKTLYLTTMYASDENPSKAKGVPTAQRETVISKSFSFDVLNTLGTGVSWDKGNIAKLGISASNFKIHGGHTTTVRQSIVIGENVARQVITIKSNVSGFADATISGHISADGIVCPKIPITGCPFANAYVSIGPYLSANVDLAVDLSFGKNVTIMASFGQDLRNKDITLIGKPLCVDHTPNPLQIKSVLLSGKIGVGAGFEIGVSSLEIMKKEVGAAISDAIYAELEGDYIIYDSDAAQASKETTVYERLKKTSISCSVCDKLDVLVGPWTFTVLNPRISLPKFDLVPDIKLSAIARDGDDYFFSKLITTGNLLLPSSIYGVIDTENVVKNSGNEIALSLGQVDRDVVLDFDDLIKGKEFNFYPVCKFMGLDLKALPSVEIPVMSDIEEITDEGAIYSDITKKNTFLYNMKHSLRDYGYSNIENKIEVSDGNDFNVLYSNDYNSLYDNKYKYVSLDDEEIQLDFSNFVATLDGSVRAVSYFVLPNSPDNSWSAVASNPYKHTFRYSKKPKVTLSDAHTTNTSVIEERTLSDGSVQKCYSTDYTFKLTREGTFWMKGWQWEFDKGTYGSTGTNLDEYIQNDRYEDGPWQLDGRFVWWEPSWHDTQHQNIYLRDGSILQSNSLIHQNSSISVSTSRSKGR